MRLANLDGLRFLAASTVVLAHVEVAKKKAGLPAWGGRFFDNSAQLAVTFFFVLSGFLICWWFLRQEGGVNKSVLRKFYGYRLSRTFPLYFALVALVGVLYWAVNQQLGYTERRQFLLYALLLPNLADWWYDANEMLGPSWSLAVEESFYFLFPLALRFGKGKKLVAFLIAATVLFMLLALLLHPLVSGDWTHYHGLQILSFIADRYRIYAFTTGALAAVLWVSYPHRLAMLRQRQYMVLPLAVLLLFLGGVTFSVLTQQVYSILFAASLLVLVCRGKALLGISMPFVVWGGRISFGVYLLHMLIVMFLLPQLQKHPHLQWLAQAMGPAVLLAVLLLAAVVYYCFEMPVLTWLRRRLLPHMD